VTLFPERTIDGRPAQVATPPTKRSAGTAWLLSLLAPGAGQLYCGATTRGLATLLAFAGSVAILIFATGDLKVVGLRMAVMLYAFAGLDAYATAAELKMGIEADAPDNPRVAGVLNMMTNGLGYVYLGWKIGFGTVLLLSAFWRTIGAILPVVGEAVAIALATHAYLGAHKARAEIYQRSPDVTDETSHVPPVLTWAVSWLVLGGYFLLVVVAQVVLLRRFFSK
jgi:TM2 domain-containing membrane protein YozV